MWDNEKRNLSPHYCDDSIASWGFNEIFFNIASRGPIVRSKLATDLGLCPYRLKNGRGPVARKGARASWSLGPAGTRGRALNRIQGPAPVRKSRGEVPWSWKPFSFWVSLSNLSGKVCHINCIASTCMPISLSSVKNTNRAYGHK